MPHRDGVAAVDRALALLAAFDGDAPSLSLSELSRATGLVKSTVLRLAASLERSGYLRRGSDARYRLGPALARLSARYQAAFQLGDHVMPALERLADATGESSAFYVRDGDQSVCLHRVNSRQRSAGRTFIALRREAGSGTVQFFCAPARSMRSCTAST